MSIAIGGKPIEARWWGPAPDAAPTIVLLHEGLGCVALWRDVPARLAEMTGCGVFAYSRFGYGASAPAALPRQPHYMHNEAQDVLGLVLDRANIQRAILLGHSDGGSIATIYAGGVADLRVRGLILIAAHFFVEEICIASIKSSKTAYETTSLRERLGRYHQDPDNAFWGWNAIWLDPRFLDWRIDDYIPAIRVPTLLVQGSADEYGSLAQFDSFQSKARCSVETAIIEGAGHSPHLSHEAQTLPVIAAFVEKLRRINSPEPI